MLLPGPLQDFSRSTHDRGQVIVPIRVPCQLTFIIEVCRAALAWEIVSACEKAEQTLARQAQASIHTSIRSELGINDGRWLDGAFSRAASRIIECIATDLSRVHPRPVVLLTCPDLSEEDTAALDNLGQLLNISIRANKTCLVDNTESPDKVLAAYLLGTSGIVNNDLLLFLAKAADNAQDHKLATALFDFGVESGSQVILRNTKPQADDRLNSVFRAIKNAEWPSDLPDWANLGLPAMLKSLWTDPKKELDRLRRDSSQQMRTQKNAYYVRLTIARQFLRCWDDEALAMRIDLAEASLDLRNKRPLRGWQLLLPHLQSQTLRSDPVLAAHIYGQAGQAAARLGKENDSLAL